MASIAEAWLEQRTAISQAPVVSSMKQIVRHMGWLTIDEMRPGHTKRYAERRSAEGAAVGTVIEELNKLSAALNWAMGEKIIIWRPTMDYPKAPPSRDRWLTEDEAALLLASCKVHHIWLYIHVALGTAARKSAILELTWDRVDLKGRLIDFGHKQGGKPRTKPPINNALYPILAEAKSARQSDYVIEWAGGRVTQIDKGFARTAARAGIPEVTPHDLRRTAATWMAMKGVDMRDISQYLGHSETSITERIYARYQPDHLRRAAKALEW